MQEENHHIIHTQVLEVEMESVADAFNFRNEVAELYHDKILPRLQTLFDELSSAGKHTTVDNISIDLGNISETNWEEQLTEKALIRIREALSSLPPAEVNTHELSTEINKELKQDFDDALFQFLRTGLLPWNISKKTFDLNIEMQEWIKQEHFIHTFSRFLANAGGEELNRLVLQFDEETLQKILSVFLTEEEITTFQILYGLKSRIEALYYGKTTTGKARNFIYKKVFEWLSNSTSQPLETFFLQLLSYSVSGQNETALNILIEEMKDAFLKEGIAFEPKDIPNNRMANDAAGFIENEKLIQEKSNTNGINPVTKEEVIYVDNAGLVLLHPFLQPLFLNLGLLNEENKFKNDEHHARAVLISQFLVTGDPFMKEYDLFLNKLLLGFPLQGALPAVLDITGSELAEFEEVLTQVIDHWQKNNIKVNNSIDGLRTSFLQRMGKLTHHEKNPKMQVEQKPYDMLLTAVPWSFSIIKTTWMKELLWVEWA